MSAGVVNIENANKSKAYKLIFNIRFDYLCAVDETLTHLTVFGNFVRDTQG